MADLLVIDSDATVRDALVALLEDAGHRVAGAPTAQAALERLLAGPQPDLILLGDGPSDAPKLLETVERALARDVSDRRRIDARLQMTERLVSVGTLATGVAHEINNPLAYVATNLRFIAERTQELLARTPDGEAATTLRDILDAVADAEDGATRVQRIVRDLKTFARAGDERQRAIDVRQVLDAAINLAAHEMRPRARLRKDYQDVPEVMGNEAQLGQLFLNLLLNAAQALPDGDADANEIRVSTRAGCHGRAIVEIADTGRGIPAQQLSRIFDPFYTTRPVGTGVGLGLAVVHGIVMAMHGEIAVESEPGKGTTFRVLLPALAPKVAQPTGPQNARAPVRARLLVVDDEPALTLAVQRVLGQEHDVVVAGSGREALALLERDPSFDLILCDLMMPDLTGFDVYERLWAERPALASRIVFTTGGVFTPRARQFLDQVPNPSLEKPFDLDRLRALIAKATTRA